MPAFASTQICTSESVFDLECIRAMRLWKQFYTDRTDLVVGALRGKYYCTVATNGNGACALHSVFGRPQGS